MSVEEQETSQEEEIPSKIKTYTCRYCGEGPFTLPKLGTHLKTCSERLKAVAKVKRKPEVGETRPPEVAEARQLQLRSMGSIQPVGHAGEHWVAGPARTVSGKLNK